MLAESPLRRAARYGAVLLAAVASVATSEDVPEPPADVRPDAAQLSGNVMLTPDNPTTTLHLRVNAQNKVYLTIVPRLPENAPTLLSSEGSAIDQYAQITLTNGDGQQQAVWLKRDGTTTSYLRMEVSSERPATVTFRLSPIAKATSSGGPVELLVRYEADATTGIGDPTALWVEDPAP